MSTQPQESDAQQADTQQVNNSTKDTTSQAAQAPQQAERIPQADDSQQQDG